MDAGILSDASCPSASCGSGTRCSGAGGSLRGRYAFLFVIVARDAPGPAGSSQLEMDGWL